MVISFVKTSPAQNTTILITSFCPSECYAYVSNRVMDHEYLCAEQVGFILPPATKDSVVRLEMAGGEFCGNATLSAAAYARYKGLCGDTEFSIDSSGAERPIRCRVEQRSPFVFTARCEMPPAVSIWPFTVKTQGLQVTGHVVDLKGISHFVFESWLEHRHFDDIVESLKEGLEAKAVGVVPYRKTNEREYEIRPYVYVRRTGTRVFEKGCGSGSLALGLHLRQHVGIVGKLRVRQPGGVIDVETGDGNYISTDVRFVCEGSFFIDQPHTGSVTGDWAR